MDPKHDTPPVDDSLESGSGADQLAASVPSACDIKDSIRLAIHAGDLPKPNRDRLTAVISSEPSRAGIINAANAEPIAADDLIEQHRLITKRELLTVIPRSFSSIWAMSVRGEFPNSVRIGSRVYWRWSEVKQWLDELPRSQYAAPNPPNNVQTGSGQ